MMFNTTFGLPPQPNEENSAKPKKNSKTLEGPKRILSITALGPLATDRNVISVEMELDEVLKYKSAKKEIEFILKESGLKMIAPIYWIDGGIHRVNLPSYCDWPWHLKHSNYNLYCECDKIEKA